MAESLCSHQEQAQLKSTRKFVLEWANEPVQPTGMTHSEFLHYIASSGERENDQFTERQRLEALLRKLDNENPPV